MSTTVTAQAALNTKGSEVQEAIDRIALALILGEEWGVPSSIKLPEDVGRQLCDEPGGELAAELTAACHDPTVIVKIADQESPTGARLFYLSKGGFTMDGVAIQPSCAHIFTPRKAS